MNETEFGANFNCVEDNTDGDSITWGFTLSPTPPATFLSLSAPRKCRFSFLSLNNSFAGVYTVTLHAYDLYTNSSQHDTSTFPLTLIANDDVTVLATPSNKFVTARRYNNYSLPNPLFDNDAGETINYSFTVNPPSSVIYFDWVYFSVIVRSNFIFRLTTQSMQIQDYIM